MAVRSHDGQLPREVIACLKNARYVFSPHNSCGFVDEMITYLFLLTASSSHLGWTLASCMRLPIYHNLHVTSMCIYLTLDRYR